MKKLYFFLLFLSLPAISYSQWEPCNTGLTEFYNQCIISEKDTIFAGGSGGLYYSADYGDNWKNISANLVNKTVWCILKRDNNIFVGTPGGVFNTSDYGDFWMKRNSGLLDYRIISLASNGNDILAGSQSSGIFSSSDDGWRWFTKNKGISNLCIYDIIKKGNNLFSAATNDSGSGGVYCSKDNGVNWTWTSLQKKGIYHLFVKDNDIYAGTDGDGLFVSTDDGVNWTDRSNGEMLVTVQAIESYKKYLFMAVWQGGVLYSEDNGFTWVSKSDGLTNLTLRTLIVCGDYLFAGTYYGGMYRAKLIDIVPTAVEETKFREDLSIYPNPAYDCINFTDDKGLSEYMIRDLKGNLCQMGFIMDKRIDISRLAPGMYFVRIGDNVRMFLKI